MNRFYFILCLNCIQCFTMIKSFYPFKSISNVNTTNEVFLLVLAKLMKSHLQCFIYHNTKIIFLHNGYGIWLESLFISFYFIFFYYVYFGYSVTKNVNKLVYLSWSIQVILSDVMNTTDLQELLISNHRVTLRTKCFFLSCFSLLFLLSLFCNGYSSFSYVNSDIFMS